MTKQLVRMHNQEVYFYENFAQDCKDVFFPRMFAGVESDMKKLAHGKILLEDVGNTGVMVDFFDGVNLAQVKVIATR